MQFNIEVFLAILKVMPITLGLSIISFILALILSIFIAVIEYFDVPVLKQFNNLYVSFFRGTPLIPQLFLLYFGIPTFIPSLRQVPAYYICIVGLTLNSAAYMKEVIRGSLLSVPVGQREAALAHGMSKMDTMFKIILPQATVMAIPSLFNNLVDIIKGSSVAFTIGVVEMTAVANLRASVTYNYFQAYIILMLMYWVIILFLEYCSRRLERRNLRWIQR